MKKVQKPRKPLIVYYLIALGVLIVINFVLFPMMMNGNIEEVDYGTFLTMVEEKQVSKVQLEGETIYFTDKSETPQQYETTRFEDPDLVNRLRESGCEFGRVAEEQMNPFLSMLLSLVIPIVVFIIIGQILSRQLMKKMGGGADGGPFMQFGKSNAKMYVQSETGITFNDVAGEDEQAAFGLNSCCCSKYCYARATHADGLSLQALAVERLARQGDDVGHARHDPSPLIRPITCEKQCRRILEIHQQTQPITAIRRYRNWQ